MEGREEGEAEEERGGRSAVAGVWKVREIGEEGEIGTW